MIKAIFFDNDGILVDTEHIYYSATKATLEKVNFNLTEEIFIEYFLRQGTGVWHLVNGIDEKRKLELRDNRNQIYTEMLKEKNALIENVENIIRQLCKTYKLGIVTSCIKSNFEIIHKQTGILKYFDFILTREDYSKSKPDPEPYLTALSEAEVEKHEAVIVEDSERGLLAAQAAGIECIVIPRGFTNSGNFSGALKVLKNIGELPQLLNKLKG